MAEACSVGGVEVVRKLVPEMLIGYVDEDRQVVALAEVAHVDLDLDVALFLPHAVMVEMRVRLSNLRADDGRSGWRSFPR